MFYCKFLAESEAENENRQTLGKVINRKYRWTLVFFDSQYIRLYAIPETEITYHRYLMIDNSAIIQYFLMKLCVYFTEYFRMKCTKFGLAFRFLISIWYIVGFTFSGHIVYILMQISGSLKREGMGTNGHWYYIIASKLCSFVKIRPANLFFYLAGCLAYIQYNMFCIWYPCVF